MKIPHVVGRLAKNGSEEIRVSIDRYRGRILIDSRIWYVEAKPGQWKPSKRGFAIPIKNLPRLAGVFEKTVRAARKNALLDEGVKNSEK